MTSYAVNEALDYHLWRLTAKTIESMLHFVNIPVIARHHSSLYSEA